MKIAGTGASPGSGAQWNLGRVRRCLSEVSQKVPTQTLRELERDGIVHRKSYNQVSPKVIYSVTRYGRALGPILVALCNWGERDFKRQAKHGSKSQRN